MSAKKSPTIGALVVVAVGLSGCSTMNDNQKATMGAIGGGLVASAACMLAKGSPVLCAAIGVAGALVGGAIGHRLDERDKQMRAQALQQALNDAQLWSGPNGGPPQYPPAQAPQDQSQGSGKRKSKKAAAPPPPPPPAPEVTWQNPDTKNSGKIVPLKSYVKPTTGRECKEFQETYIRDGHSVTQNTRACKKPDGTFDYEDF